ncbi:hypothetical protein D3C84_863770 [compost metagenome]
MDWMAWSMMITASWAPFTSVRSMSLTVLSLETSARVSLVAEAAAVSASETLAPEANFSVSMLPASLPEARAVTRSMSPLSLTKAPTPMLASLMTVASAWTCSAAVAPLAKVALKVRAEPSAIFTSTAMAPEALAGALATSLAAMEPEL